MTSVEVEYNRHTLIRQVMEETDLISPDDIAAIVEQRTTDEELRAWYRETLKPDIRAEFLRMRKRRRDAPLIDAARENKESGSSKTKPQMIRDAWLLKMQAPVTVDGEWKRLGDCDSDDVLRLAEVRYESAEAVRREGDRFKRLAAAMDEHGVSCAADLPADVGLDIL